MRPIQAKDFATRARGLREAAKRTIIRHEKKPFNRRFHRFRREREGQQDSRWIKISRRSADFVVKNLRSSAQSAVSPLFALLVFTLRVLAPSGAKTSSSGFRRGAAVRASRLSRLRPPVFGLQSLKFSKPSPSFSLLRSGPAAPATCVGLFCFGGGVEVLLPCRGRLGARPGRVVFPRARRQTGPGGRVRREARSRPAAVRL